MREDAEKNMTSAPPATSSSESVEIEKAFSRADHIVMRQYIKYLSRMPVARLAIPQVKDSVGTRNLRASDQSCFFRVGKLVYDSEENNLQKLTNVYSAASAINANLGVILYSDGKTVEMYMGVRGEQDWNRRRPNAESLYQYLTGNFQGSLEPDSMLENDELSQVLEKCFSQDNTVISSVSGVASVRSKEMDTNAEFNQGIEKLLDTMRGKPFAALLLADSVTQAELADIRAELELLYSSLVPFSKSDLSYSDTQSEGVTKSLSSSVADTVGTNRSSALAIGTSESRAHTEGQSITHADTFGVNAGINKGVHAGGGASPGFHLGIHYSHSISRAKSFSDTTTFGKSETSTQTEGSSQAHTVTRTNSDGTTEQYTTGKTLQLHYENKSVSTLLEKIDGQLERIKASESFGMFAAAAYFIAPDRALAEMAASAYKAIISGSNTGLETAAVNSWDKNSGMDEITPYLRLLWHPAFHLDDQNSVTPASLISAQELAIQMGLPKKSVVGVSVIETASFGRNIYRAGGNAIPAGKKLRVGTLYHMGQQDADSPVMLDLESLSTHTFVTGSTGSGKSNTVFQILSELKKKKKHFLVIEPAKGEYKHIFGGFADVRVYGTNPNKTDLLRINPFRFPPDIHILEHLDRLVEIFNVAWPMYAAMPAVLKDAVERAYAAAGWDLRHSANRYDSNLFPTFQDVLEQIQSVLAESAYSADNKSDYTGALTTRIKSLTNGLNGMIFCCNDISDQELFDENVIVDLSRVGSVETKSLIMGLLVMKLQEYRLAQSGGEERPLEHITVLEEAHNLLKRTSTEQSQDSGNLTGKSVEMLANAIAEMRSYGEGFIIADQAPGLLDMAVIRNTNTKIILRLPDYSDRELVGRAAGLNDKQIQELSKLAKGVAAVYQNDWIEAILCQVDYYRTTGSVYSGPSNRTILDDTQLKHSFLDAIVKNKLMGHIDKVDREILNSSLPTQFKCRLFDYLSSSGEESLMVLSKAAYAFFNSPEVMNKCNPDMPADEFRKVADAYLEPSLREYSQAERDLALLLLIHEQSIRDAGFYPLYEAYTLDYERRHISG